MSNSSRAAFERYFATSRKSKGAGRDVSFSMRPDGTYADDHTQRHWWTWQQAQAAERERCASKAENYDLGTPEGHAIAALIRAA